tara:strand:- start:5520 stop:6425 length:906 start_codon:yes stop_codon:yes gene_type:complete
MKKDIIHIGAHKTATTSFQKNLFIHERQIGYLGQHCLENNQVHLAIDSLINDDDYDYKKDILKKKIEDIKKRDINQFIFSNEDIVTSRFLTQSAKRLKDLLPNSTVVLSIRSQFSALQSWYISHGSKLKLVPRGYWNKFVSYNDWFNYIFEFNKLSITPHQNSPLEAMNYKKIYDVFSKHFGEENIKILVYENFSYNKKKFLSEWSNLTGINVEKIEMILNNNNIERLRESQVHFNLRRFFKFFSFSGNFEKFLKILNFGKRAKISFKKKEEEKIKEYFGEGNNFLNKKFNLELDKFNYPL